jgi:hypothetical protein
MIRRALAGYDRSIVAPPSVLVQAASRCWIGAPLTSFVVHEAADGHDDMLRYVSNLSHHAVAKEINYLFYSIETDDRVHGILSHGDIMRISNTSQRGWLYRKNRFYISAWMSRDNLRI